MRKRQIKKFAKNAKKNMTPYRQANNGPGSKKLVRRRQAFERYSSPAMNISRDRMRQFNHRMKLDFKSIKSWTDVTKALVQVGATIQQFSDACFNIESITDDVEVVTVTDTLEIPQANTE